MLFLRALINHSSRVYADANTARLTLRPYQLTESSPQSIIPHVTRHVVGRRVRKQTRVCLRLDVCSCLQRSMFLC